MSKLKLAAIRKFVGNTAIGGISGYVAAGSASDAKGRHEAAREGALIGGVVGSITGLPFKQLAKSGYDFSKVVTRGLKATPSSKVGGAMRAAEKTGQRAGVVFKRIRGRIVPVRSK